MSHKYTSAEIRKIADNPALLSHERNIMYQYADRIDADELAAPAAYEIRCPVGLSCIEMIAVPEFVRSKDRAESLSRQIEALCGEPATLTALYKSAAVAVKIDPASCDHDFRRVLYQLHNERCSKCGETR